MFFSNISYNNNINWDGDIGGDEDGDIGGDKDGDIGDGGAHDGGIAQVRLVDAPVSLLPR